MRPDPAPDHPISALPGMQPGMEGEVTELLNSCFGGAWGTVEAWRWKHSRRPGYDATDVKLFNGSDGLVACFHAQLVPFRIAAGVTLPVSMEGDVAVLPEYRGFGLTDEAHVAIGAAMYRRGAVLRIGFSTPELLKRLYGKRFGHVVPPTITMRHQKILKTSRLSDKTAELSRELIKRPLLQKVLRDSVLLVRLRVRGFDPILLEVSNNEVRPAPGGEADLDLALPYDLLVAAKLGRAAFLRVFLMTLLSGKVRCRGLLRLFGKRRVPARAR